MIFSTFLLIGSLFGIVQLKFIIIVNLNLYSFIIRIIKVFLKLFSHFGNSDFDTVVRLYWFSLFLLNNCVCLINFFLFYFSFWELFFLFLVLFL